MNVLPLHFVYATTLACLACAVHRLDAAAQPSPRPVLSWPATDLVFTPESAAALGGRWGLFPGTVVRNGVRNEVRLDFFTVERAGAARPLDVFNVSEARDRGATLTSDGLTLYFCSDRNGHFDIFTSTRTSLTSPWSAPQSVDSLNTEGDEAFPALSGDGLTIVFADSFTLPSTRAGNQGGADLWIAQRASLTNHWQAPVHLGNVINRPIHDSSPVLSRDGRTLIFNSERRGGFGGFDLWSVTRTDVSDPLGWSAPVNLGAAVNSSASDCCASLSPDGLLIFFSSGRPSPGRPTGLNSIWLARRESVTEQFREAVSLGDLLPEFHAVFDPQLTPDGASLIFNSRGPLSDPKLLGDLWEVPVTTGLLKTAGFFRLQPAFSTPIRVQGPSPLGNIDSRERGPDFSDDGLTLYFCADPNGDMDLWSTTRSALGEPWQKPATFEVLNTPANEAFPAITSDGLTLYFTDWFLGLENFKPDGLGKGDLWVSTRASSQLTWGRAVNLGPVINSEYGEGTPEISSDGRTLIFTSDRPGNVVDSGANFNALDLWMSTRTDLSNPTAWGEPVNLGPLINSPQADWSPKLSRDGLALFFVSGRPGLGRRDVTYNIWVARRHSLAEPFNPPVNLEPNFTTLFDLLDPCPSPDGKTLLFATRGLFSETPTREFVDLWQATLQAPPSLSIGFVANPSFNPGAR